MKNKSIDFSIYAAKSRMSFINSLSILAFALMMCWNWNEKRSWGDKMSWTSWKFIFLSTQTIKIIIDNQWLVAPDLKRLWQLSVKMQSQTIEFIRGKEKKTIDKLSYRWIYCRNMFCGCEASENNKPMWNNFEKICTKNSLFELYILVPAGIFYPINLMR